MWGRFSRGSREISGTASRKDPAGLRCESLGSTTAAYDPEKLDRPIVSEKPVNKSGLRCPAAEPVEKRGLASLPAVHRACGPHGSYRIASRP